MCFVNHLVNILPWIWTFNRLSTVILFIVCRSWDVEQPLNFKWQRDCIKIKNGNPLNKQTKLYLSELTINHLRLIREDSGCYQHLLLLEVRWGCGWGGIPKPSPAIIAVGTLRVKKKQHVVSPLCCWLLRGGDTSLARSTSTKRVITGTKWGSLCNAG